MTQTTTEVYCANHPGVATTLRCNRCEKPICAKCAVLTPTGYRCRECVSGQQKAFSTAQWYDYPLAFALAGGFALLGSLIVPRLGFFTIFVAPIAGGLIAELVRAVLRKRRSPQLYKLTAAAAALGSLVPLLPVLLGVLLGGSMGYLLTVIWQVLYAFLVTSTVYYRMSGIQLKY